MAHDVFLSYSNRDRPVVDQILAHLEAAGLRCWIAPRDIRPGLDWAEAIVHAIRACRVMVLVSSSHALRSPRIQREVACAVDAGVAILPLRIEHVPPTEAFDDVIGPSQWLDAFPPPIEDRLVQLTRAVHGLLSRPAPDTRLPSRWRESSSAGDRRCARADFTEPPKSEGTK